MRRILTLFCFAIAFVSNALSESVLVENFDYAPGDSLVAHGWIVNSGGSLNRILVSSPGLVYSGYALSGIGNSAALQTTGQDVYKNCEGIFSNGAVYASFLVRVTSAARPGDYFAALLPSTSATFFSGRVNVRLRSGVLEFGLTKASPLDTNSMVWATGYALNTTYLVVLKYEFVAGSANDLVSLFILPGGMPMTEPVPTIGPMNFSSTSGDANDIGRFALRQGTAGRAPGLLIDGIMVSDSWLMNVKFYQLNHNYDGWFQTNSDWGKLEISFYGLDTTKYVNLSVSAPGVPIQWQVQNCILVQWQESGTQQSNSFEFDIGDVGIDVTNIQYGLSITDAPLLVPPPITGNAQVQDYDEIVYSGVYSPNPITMVNYQPAVPLLCAIAREDIYYHHKNFPNQDCGVNECAPASISNSLKFLKKQHKLDIPDTVCSIDSLKKVTNWDPVTKVPLDWATKKKENMEKNNMPVTTRIITVDTNTVWDSLAKMRDELLSYQDIEMWVWGDNNASHVINLIGVSKKKDGKIKIKTSEDDTQGQPGARKNDVKESTFDSATKKFTEGHMVKVFNKGIFQFVVECPNTLNSSLVIPENESTVDPNNMHFEWQCTNCDFHPVTYWLEVADDPAFQNKIIDDRSVPVPNYMPAPGLLLADNDYFWRVRVNDSAGPGSYDTIYRFITALPKILSLNATIQGLYYGSGMIPDTAVIYLRNQNPPYSVVDSSKGVLNSLGSGAFNFYNAVNGINYYIEVTHRNSIETWSSYPLPFNSGVMNFDFTSSLCSAYGCNLIQTGPVYSIYNGDVNQDKTIDISDIIAVFNDANAFVSGYETTDINGDLVVDLSDLVITFNNAINFVSSITPLTFADDNGSRSRNIEMNNNKSYKSKQQAEKKDNQKTIIVR